MLDKEVPWKYDVEIRGGKEASTAEVYNTKETAVTNIAGIEGMTRNDRVYTPMYLRRDSAVEKEPEKVNLGGKEYDPHKNDERRKGVKKAVTEEEACEFLKLIRQSEYTVIEQLNHIPARISLLALVMNSEPHRKVLLKILNETHVVHNLSIKKFERIVGNINATNFITFTDDEIPGDRVGHNNNFYISVKCMNLIIRGVLIDNGSAINIMSQAILSKLPFGAANMKPSFRVVRAFDGSKREVIGEVELPIQIGPVTFNVVFQVMDIQPLYNCLLGRPWIHCAQAVPSTLHQKLKFIVEDRLIIVSGEEDLLVSKTTKTPYIESAEEALKTHFQALEIANVSWVKEGESIQQARLSSASRMTAKMMLANGFKPGDKLGKNGHGLLYPLELKENKSQFGLGYKPTLEKTQARKDRDPWCHISRSFYSAGFEFLEDVAAMDDEKQPNTQALVTACAPGVELNNWR